MVGLPPCAFEVGGLCIGHTRDFVGGTWEAGALRAGRMGARTETPRGAESHGGAVGACAQALLLWHLLSLDAPTVAVLWTVFLARLAHVVLPAGTCLGMGVGVWVLYVLDRLIDAHPIAPREHAGRRQELELRHLFHYRHRSAFAVTLVFAAILLAVLLPRISHAAAGLYLVEAAVLGGYFLLIHAASPRIRGSVPKEFMVGLFFAGATFVPVVSETHGYRPTLMLDALFFSAVCTLNCLYIYAWEHPGRMHPHGLTRLALGLLLPGTVALLALSLPMILFSVGPPGGEVYPMACLLSAAALLLLHGFRARFSRTGLRAAADAALLTPILFLVFR